MCPSTPALERGASPVCLSAPSYLPVRRAVLSDPAKGGPALVSDPGQFHTRAGAGRDRESVSTAGRGKSTTGRRLSSRARA